MADDAAAMDVDGGPEESQLSKDLKEVIKLSIAANGLVRGLREVVKTLVRGQAQLVVLAKDCDDASYKALVRALCNNQNVYIVEVESREELGMMVGLFKMYKKDKEGQPVKDKKKIVKCSAVCIHEFGQKSAALANVNAQLAKAE